MENKQTPVEFLESKWSNYSVQLGKSGFNMYLKRAKAMEAEREAKYQKMLEKLLTKIDPHSENELYCEVEQLIKEVEDGK